MGPGKAHEAKLFGPPLSQDTSYLSLLEIRAPEPPVGTGDLDPQQFITPYLAGVVQNLRIEQRFRPAVKERAVRPSERGYWLVDCSMWGDETVKHTWGLLKNCVSDGKAGWGVWCSRAEDWSWIRVYCWGSIVGHIYLLLYIASQRQVLFSGASWIGGDGTPVFTMTTRQP